MNAFETIYSTLTELFGYLNDANKRIYYLYLLSAILLAIPVYRAQATGKTKSLKGFFAQLFDRRIWLAESAKQDYALWILNKLIKAIVYAPAILVMVPVALWFGDWLNNSFDTMAFLDWPKWAIIATFTVTLFIVDDFTRFLLHYILHKVPFLWHFHKVHHSAKVLTPFTVYRSHPVESYLYACRMALSQGLVVGASYYVFGPNLSMYDVVGANVFVFAFNIMGSNLRHSHVRLGWGDKIEKWFISPAQHQIHHSDQREHFDTNLGSALAIWDRAFGTLILSSKVGRLRFGLGKNNNEHHNLLAIYIEPFKALFRRKAS